MLMPPPMSLTTETGNSPVTAVPAVYSGSCGPATLEMNKLNGGAPIVATRKRWEDRAMFQQQRALKPRAPTRRREDCVRGCWVYANQTVAIGYEVSPNKSPRGSDPGAASTAAVAGPSPPTRTTLKALPAGPRHV